MDTSIFLKHFQMQFVEENFCIFYSKFSEAITKLSNKQ